MNILIHGPPQSKWRTNMCCVPLCPTIHRSKHELNPIYETAYPQGAFPKRRTHRHQQSLGVLLPNLFFIDSSSKLAV